MAIAKTKTWAGTRPVSISRKEWTFFFVFSCAFALPGIGAIIFGLISFQRAWTSQSWPTTQGVVQSATLKYYPPSGEHRSRYGAAIHYEFGVEGKRYRGQKVTFSDVESGDPSYAQAIVDRYAKRRDVTVHYLASNPDLCVLEPGVTMHNWMIIIIGVLFVLTGLWVGALPFKARKVLAARARYAQPKIDASQAGT